MGWEWMSRVKLLPRATLIFGLLLLLLSGGAAYYKFKLFLTYGNVGNSPNWVPTVQPTGLDALIWRTPIYVFALAAIVLIAVGVAKSRNKTSDCDVA